MYHMFSPPLLDHDSITELANRYGHAIHMASVTYVREKFLDLYTILKEENSQKTLFGWVYRSCRTSCYKFVLGKLETAVDEFRKKFGMGREHDSFLVDSLKLSILQSLMEYIIRSQKSPVILPWGIQRTILEDQRLSKILGVTENKFSVSINSFTSPEKWTLEFTYGVLAFSLIRKKNFHLKILGSPVLEEFTPEIFNWHNYSSSGTTNGREFSDGFCFGAFLENVHPSLLWRIYTRYPEIYVF